MFQHLYSMGQALTSQPDLWSVLQCLTSLIAQSQEFYFPFLWLGWSSWLLKYFWDPCFVLGLLDLEAVIRDIAAYSTSGYGTPVYICFKMPKLAVLWWSLPASSSVKASCRFLHQLSPCEVPKSVLCPVYPQGRSVSLLGALADLQVSSWSSPSMWTENNVDTLGFDELQSLLVYPLADIVHDGLDSMTDGALFSSDDKSLKLSACRMLETCFGTVVTMSYLCTRKDDTLWHTFPYPIKVPKRSIQFHFCYALEEEVFQLVVHFTLWTSIEGHLSRLPCSPGG